jgi:hypothetical protein
MRVRPVPQFAPEPVGLLIYQNGVLVDPDANEVTLEVANTDNNTIVVPAGTVATRESTGKYSFTLNSEQTSIKGYYLITWTYSMDSSPRLSTDDFEVTGQMPYWQSLSYEERQLAVNVFNRIDGSFDSTQGGPYLQEMKQSNFNAYEQVSFIMTTETVDYCNFEFQPVFQPAYEIGIGANAPWPPNWYGILTSQTYAMTLKHVARQYIEQPLPEGMNAAWLNRRDYYDRWMELYKIEKEIADKQLRQMKRTYMVGSKRSMLVAGGLIPRMFINPARPHFMYAAANSGGV